MKAWKYPLRVLQNRLGQVPRPSWCTYLVCNRCNAQCGMCDSWRIPAGYEMTPSEVACVFGKLGPLDVVRLSGGEPFLRSDFLEVAEAVQRVSSPGVLHITTNGSFPERVEHFATRFSQPKRLRFMVSLDGLAEVHDRSRGKRVSFERAIQTLERLVRLRDSGLDVSVNHTVISAQSLRDHSELKRRLGTLGVDVQWVLAYSESSMYGAARRGKRASDLVVVQGYPLHPDLDPAAAAAFAQAELANIEDIRNPVLRTGKRYYLEGLLARLRQTHAAPGPKCVALRSHVRLLPDGSVPVCQFNTEVVGNLLHAPFDDVWFGAECSKQRAWVDACTGCWAECEVMPNAVYSGDILTHAAQRLLRSGSTRRAPS